MVILAPLLAPVAKTLGIDLVHFRYYHDCPSWPIGMDVTSDWCKSVWWDVRYSKSKDEGMFSVSGFRYFAALVQRVLFITYVPLAFTVVCKLIWKLWINPDP